MKTVTSKDGTRIAYEQLGSGPPLLLVDGAFCGRGFGPMAKLAALLSAHFTVIHYDRRGRGDSGNTAPYAVARELEDIQALVDAAGGSVAMYGISSGAVLAARAVAHGVNVKKLFLYEPPLALDGTHHPSPADFIEQIDSMLANSNPNAAVKLFMKVVGMPAFAIAIMRWVPGVWPKLRAVAPTLRYDFAVLGDTQRGGPLPAELKDVLANIHIPVRVGAGGKSLPWMHHAAKTVAAGIAGATTTVIPGQDHKLGEKAAAPVLLEFFGAAEKGVNAQVQAAAG